MKFLSLQSSTHTIDPFPPLLLLLIPLLLFPGRSTPRGPTSFPLPSSVQQSSRGGGIIILAMLPVDLSRTHRHYTHARTRSVCVLVRERWKLRLLLSNWRGGVGGKGGGDSSAFNPKGKGKGEGEILFPLSKLATPTPSRLG